MRRDTWFGGRKVFVLAVAVSVTALLAPTATAIGVSITTLVGVGTAGDAGDGGAATLASLRDPGGLAVHDSGPVYIADGGNHRVRRLDDGIITALAGSGVAGYAGDGEPASGARLDTPVAVAARPSGIVLIADMGNHTVRQVDKDGVITTIAGRGRPGYTGDGGPAASAELRQPHGVGVRPSGEVFIADTGNHTIRQIDKHSVITTIAGTGQPGYTGDGSSAAAARLRGPTGLAATSSGVVYIADTGNSVIRRIDKDGVITTVAGTGQPGYSGDGGPATAAALNRPQGLAVDGTGVVYIADTGNSVIRRIDKDGVITTVAGTGQPGYGGDGGPATAAALNRPQDVAVSSGGIVIADSANHRVRLLSGGTPPEAPTSAGSVPDSPANDNNPRMLGRAPSGSTVHLYTDPDCASPVAASGTAETFATTGLTVHVADDSVTTFYATALNATGLRSVCSMLLPYIEDSTAPDMPVILSAPRDPADRTPEWAFTAEPGATITCQLARGATVLWAYATCSDRRTYDLGGQADGRYTLSVRATDAAGNVGPTATSTHQLSTHEATAPLPGSTPESPGTPAPEPDRGTVPTPSPTLVPADRQPAPNPVPVDQQPAPSGSAPPPAVSGPTESPFDEPQLVGSPAPTAAGAASAEADAHPPAPRPSPETALPTTTPSVTRRVLEGIVGELQPLLTGARTVGGAMAENPAFPTALGMVVGLFLVAQHHIDSRDPKLALAPLEKAELEFAELVPIRTPPTRR